VLPPGFRGEEEVRFYNNDKDFMRFHKRTRRNMHEVLQELLDSSKQTMSKGVKQLNNVTINYIDLNKACSLLVAYWTINTMPMQSIPEDVFDAKALENEEELKRLLEEEKQAVLKQKANPLKAQENIEEEAQAIGNKTTKQKLKELNR